MRVYIYACKSQSRLSLTQIRRVVQFALVPFGLHIRTHAHTHTHRPTHINKNNNNNNPASRSDALYMTKMYKDTNFT